MSTEPLVVIPARLASSRLPGKPLKKIGNKTLIEHCVDSARLAGVGPYVVSDSMDVISAAGMFPLAPSVRKALVSQSDCETGTDRVAEFVERTLGWERAPDWIINVQGDMPFGTAPWLRRLIEAIQSEEYEGDTVVTPVCWQESVCINERTDCLERLETSQHVGMYAFRKGALRRFYEARNNSAARTLELEQNIEILRFERMTCFDTVQWLHVEDLLPPLEVNTQADLDRINEIVNACAGFGNPSLTADETASLALAGGG